MWLGLGGVHTVVENVPEKTSNTHLVISSSGDIVATYNKTHLFDVNIPGAVSLCESAYVRPGTSLAAPVSTPLGSLGLGVCYDLRFAEQCQELAAAGAEILTFPSAFTVNTGMAHWEPLLRARAMETQCYVVAAAQTGRHNDKRSSYGHSMIVDPWGVVTAQCGEGVGVATANIDLSYLARVRSNMPVQSHRRPDLYGRVSLLQSGGKEGEWTLRTLHGARGRGVHEIRPDRGLCEQETGGGGARSRIQQQERAAAGRPQRRGGSRHVQTCPESGQICPKLLQSGQHHHQNPE